MTWRKDGKLTGAPPDHYQCQANRRNGKRCRKWRLTYSKYCQFHGGRRRSSIVRISHLPLFYSQHLSDTLTQRLADCVDGDPREALNLFEELALTRIAASEMVKLFAAAEKVDGDKGAELRTTASVLMCDALKNVQAMCEAAARIENQGKDKYSIHSLKAIINQLVRIAYTVFKDHPEKAAEFKRLVDEEVKMPNEAIGTTLTPDRDVQDMDETVPCK